jgi:dihydropteroate synthase
VIVPLLLQICFLSMAFNLGALAESFVGQCPLYPRRLASFPQVARAAIAAGACMINDVSGGARDPLMLATAAALNVPLCLMHMRGTPATMQSLAQYPRASSSSMSSSQTGTYSRDAAILEPRYRGAGLAVDDDRAVVDAVVAELRDRCEAALRAGVRRWNIILDPGIGFAKAFEHNIACLRHIPTLRGIQAFIDDERGSSGGTTGTGAGCDGTSAHAHHSAAFGTSFDTFGGFPLLVGTSRKAFIGRILGGQSSSASVASIVPRPPAERVHGSSAAAAVCASSGADMVRVHDVPQTIDAVRVADAVRRRKPTAERKL